MNERIESTPSLLAQARAGGPPLDQFLGRLRPRLLVWVRSRIGVALAARVDPEDLVQEILAAAARALPDFEPRGRREAYSWIFRIAERRVLMAAEYHGAAKRSAARETELTSRVAGRGETPSKVASRREEYELLLEAIGELSEGHREIVRLRNLELLSNEEAAARLSITRKAASVRYVRAKRALLARVEEKRAWNRPAS